MSSKGLNAQFCLTAFEVGHLSIVYSNTHLSSRLYKRDRLEKVAQAKITLDCLMMLKDNAVRIPVSVGTGEKN